MSSRRVGAPFFEQHGREIGPNAGGAGFEIERIAVRGFGSAVLAQTSVRSRFQAQQRDAVGSGRGGPLRDLLQRLFVLPLLQDGGHERTCTAAGSAPSCNARRRFARRPAYRRPRATRCRAEPPGHVVGLPLEQVFQMDLGGARLAGREGRPASASNFSGSVCKQMQVPATRAAARRRERRSAIDSPTSAQRRPEV